MLPLLLLLAAPLFAAEAELLAAKPATAIVNEVLELKPAPGHHFGTDAPQKCGGVRAWEVIARRFRCRLEKPGDVAVVASVCDDAKTFCKQTRFTVKVTGRASGASSPAAAAPKGKHGGPAGFVLNDPAAAQARAKKDGKLLFMHFYGIWCPPCNELEEHAYPHADFQAALKDYVAAALDADAPVSFDWKARLKIGGYPTIVVTDAHLREIGRVVGSRSGPALAAFMSEMKALANEPVEAALKKAATDPAAALRVAKWRSERAEFDDVERLLAKRTDPAARLVLLNARSERTRRASDTAARTVVVRDLLKEFPEDANFATWAGLLAGEDKAEAVKLKDAVSASVAKWAASPELGATWFSPGDMFAEEADFIGTIESTTAAKPLWLKAAAAHEARAASSPLGAAARGANFGRAYALRQAGENASAAVLLEYLVKAYPDEFTFHNEYAYALKEDGQFEKAYPAAVKAVETGYGDNWLRAVKLKAELELKLGKAKDAAKTVDDALAETVLPATTDVRSYRYVTALRNLRAEIAKKL